MARQCPECGHTYEGCEHNNTKKVSGDFGRRKDAFEKCLDCGLWWALDWDGKREKLGKLDVATGKFGGKSL